MQIIDINGNRLLKNKYEVVFNQQYLAFPTKYSIIFGQQIYFMAELGIIPSLLLNDQKQGFKKDSLSFKYFACDNLGCAKINKDLEFQSFSKDVSYDISPFLGIGLGVRFNKGFKAESRLRFSHGLVNFGQGSYPTNLDQFYHYGFNWSFSLKYGF